MTAVAAPSRSAVERTVQEFLDVEAAAVLPGSASADSPGAVRVAGIGTTAPRALGSAMLADALAARGVTVSASTAHAGPEALVAASGDWDLGVVLSPYKRDVLPFLTATSPTTALAGVADTLLSVPGGLIGLNTNSWAVVAALRTLVPSGGPDTVLLLGAGASARSTVLGIRRTWPETQLLVSARSDAAAEELAGLAGCRAVAAADVADTGADVVVNATTWGETAESEQQPYSFPFADLLRPGLAFFDLNNRRSALAEQALDKACVVLSGTLMQVVTHGCRAALASRVAAAPAGDDAESDVQASDRGRGGA